MTTLWFVVAAHGREQLAAVCLRQLRRTCDDLADHGILASAVVIACDDNLDTARALGFGTIERDNHFLGRRFNDGYQAVCREGVDFAVPLGSDDWVLPAWVAAELPPSDGLLCSRELAMVSEDGTRLSRLMVDYAGGHGIRVIPRGLLELVGGRPAEEFRRRAIDTSVFRSLAAVGARALYRSSEDPLGVVDWKSWGPQLNPSESCGRYADGPSEDPFETLAGVYPDEALEEMAFVYSRVEVAA